MQKSGEHTAAARSIVWRIYVSCIVAGCGTGSKADYSRLVDLLKDSRSCHCDDLHESGDFGYNCHRCERRRP
ncbi:hypothetical protein [Chamaesiphon sp. VAR_69_metabat_338]|uniref:hypothetical protein n=1 Tax=Chamaesiphon sp. VAR_69_metabat_338 TaxID=2964704 RepID=UPI00286E7975|nr:hypothetical protein [Chamaesiphon sp. VAR_69_metabat_338]